MPEHKITYFTARGGAEISRLIFAQAGVEYEDQRIDRKDWLQHVNEYPTKALPWLEVHGKQYNQSLAIARYLAAKFGLHGKTPEDKLKADMIVETLKDLYIPIGDVRFHNIPQEKKVATAKRLTEETCPRVFGWLQTLLGDNDFFCGDYVTYADLMWCDAMTFIKAAESVGVHISLDKLPKMKALLERVEALPNIKAWMEKRPNTIV